MKKILHTVRGYRVLVPDRHPLHKSNMVQEFIQPDKRLVVFEFPSAAPEVNPAELIWAQTKEYIAETPPCEKNELEANAYTGIAQTQVSQNRLFAFSFGSRLDCFN